MAKLEDLTPGARVRGILPERSRQCRNNGRINRDQLLQALFPNGVPPREGVLRAANSWLDEAERLAGMK